MATKSANVTARVQPEIKRQAEAVLDRIGLPVSVLIDTLYRQIIMTGGVPYPLTVPKLPTRDGLTDEQFNAMMEKGYNQAKSGNGLSVDEILKLFPIISFLSFSQKFSAIDKFRLRFTAPRP